MPIESIFVLSVIIIAFCTFGAALAWADAQTRGRKPPIPGVQRVLPGDVIRGATESPNM
jgi:hypothetical protein